MKFKRLAKHTDELLTAARSAHEAAAAKIAELTSRREAALVDGADQAAIAALDRELDDQRRAVSIEADRIALLEQKKADETSQRLAELHAERIAGLEEKFNERTALAAELSEHLQAAVMAARKIQALSSELSAAWSWQPPDWHVLLFARDGLKSALASELYRISAPNAAVSHEGMDITFPGARNPLLTDTRPTSVQPFADVMKDAAAYAARVLHEAPVPHAAQAPVVVDPAIIPAPAIPIKDAPIPSPTQPATEPPAISPSLPEFRFAVDLVDIVTGDIKTELVTFGPAEMEQTSIDPLGPSGPAGREVALRVAKSRMPKGFALARGKSSVRFDVAHLAASMDRA